ncbi:sugar phosphate isomerase/epimerase [Ferriphaselus sp. R-1]|uniref:sugar phosphate isomerase/epimerase n=1 Tax=Ferriphaselus sp. R-1 TaxID=1485544 RepID=UPI000551BE54|nr:sugar phosphate isomerase/epimerase [Ferriphaselus sp. R-1]
MELRLYKTLWGHAGSLSAAAAHAAGHGYVGLEGTADRPPEQLALLEQALQQYRLDYIQEIVTGGDYVPRRHASVAEHLADVERQLLQGKPLQPRFATIIGGCDAWTLEQNEHFFNEALAAGERHGVVLSFETHRSRSLFNPWATLLLLQRIPQLRLTCDLSHWVVVMERLLDDDLEVIDAVAQHAHHIHARVGYPQGPQVPHPAAPEYAHALASHQRCWERIWSSQAARGYTASTMTPEFGPDGYMHILPFTNEPVADLVEVNEWMASTEQHHFAQWVANR